MDVFDKASCQSSSSTDVLSCTKRISRWCWRTSRSERSMECAWCAYFATLERWRRSVLQSMKLDLVLVLETNGMPVV